MGYKSSYDGKIQVTVDKSTTEFDAFCDQLVERKNNSNVSRITNLLKKYKIQIPNNLSIIATINTSDESIYYLDSAFKRRWDWQYIDSPNKNSNPSTDIPECIVKAKVLKHGQEIPKLWWYCIIGLNEFIKSHHRVIRRIEDKQIGWWFIKPIDGAISLQEIEDKLMFYLWDSVFSRDKRPLEEALSKQTNEEISLVTYADFTQHTENLLSFATNYASEINVIPF